jgi:hypothetical protein
MLKMNSSDSLETRLFMIQFLKSEVILLKMTQVIHFSNINCGLLIAVRDCEIKYSLNTEIPTKISLQQDVMESAALMSTRECSFDVNAVQNNELGSP